MIAAAELAATLHELEGLDMKGLRQSWHQHLGTLPPSVGSRDLLRRMLAFELQAAVHGGPTSELKQKLRSSSKSVARAPLLQPGTTLTREWRGERHVVQAVDAGFEHLGTRYATLSEVARHITGARWSGPRFFGLAAPLKRRHEVEQKDARCACRKATLRHLHA